jgi:hypothetical protein
MTCNRSSCAWHGDIMTWQSTSGNLIDKPPYLEREFHKGRFRRLDSKMKSRVRENVISLIR